MLRRTRVDIGANFGPKQISHANPKLSWRKAADSYPKFRQKLIWTRWVRFVVLHGSPHVSQAMRLLR